MAPSESPSPDDLIFEVERARATPLERLDEAIGRAGSLTHVADLLVDHFVQVARAAGHSWAEIGGILGVSKQAAQQRFSANARHKAELIASALHGASWAAALHVAGLGEVAGVAGLERFTEDARHAVKNARDTAKRLGHNMVGTEHLLVGVVAEPAWVATKAFEGLGLTAAALDRKLRRARGEGKHPIPEATHVPFSERARTVLTLAMREALQMGENRIGPHHILLALTRHGEGLGVVMLDELGIDLAELRRAVRKEAAGRSAGGDEPGGGAADDQPR